MHYYLRVVERQPRSPEADVAWTRRYAELQPRLVRAVAATAGTYLGVEDAVQEAFAVALAHDRREIANLGGWLYTVAVRHLRRAQRRDAVRRLLHLREAVATTELDHAIDRIDLLSNLSQLRPRDRELLVAKYYFGLTQEEIADGFGMRRGAVSAALSRAAARFRAIERGKEGAPHARR